MSKLVVIDTNVLISSIFWNHGNPYKIVNLAIEQKINNFTSPNMLYELAKVLRENFNQSENMVESQIRLVANYSNVVQPKIKLKVVKDDPKDDMVLECALSCNVQYIITGDKHLLKLKEFKGIKIATAKEFLILNQ